MNSKKSLLFLCLLIIIHLTAGGANEKKSLESPNVRISNALSAFGTKLLIELDSKLTNENSLISPVNIYHALSVLHLAAGGNTLKEISDVLGIPAAKKYTKPVIHSTLRDYFRQEKTSEIVEIADALFVRNDFAIKNDFYSQIKKYYDADIEKTDFSKGKEAAAKINNWVSEKTKNRIPQIVDNVDENTLAVIASTLYFNGSWFDNFPDSLTKTDKFFSGEKEEDVQMMNLVKRFSYLDHTGLQMQSIDLPFSSREYMMNVILPYPTQSIKNLTRHLNNFNLKEIMAKAIYTGVDLKLPKVKFARKISLVEPLQKLGLVDIFSAANLTGMTDAKVLISKVIHGTEIEIREEGATASAVTYAEVMPASAPVIINKPVNFYVNRPFIVNIYHRATSMLLFTGIVRHPTA